MAEFFTDVTGRIPYEGPDSANPLAFHWYDPDRIVAGRRMEDHLRFAVCYWHSFTWDGFDIFGAGTLDRPWHPTFAPAADPMEAAAQKMEAAFEFFTKLGVPFYCFHDRDIAPEGASFKESAARLDEMADRAAGHQERTGVELLWGTANLFANARYQAGAATNPDPEVFAFAAAQVAHCLEVTHRLGGHNYVLWGGREGYDTLLNTDIGRELDQLGRFLSMVVEHKHRIGFGGTILIEPKPFEPTKHQYDYDVAAVHAFLQRYDLADEVKVNIEVNHATLSGHDFAHEVAVAVNAGIFGSVDANAGDDRLGWDVDRFPVSVEQMALGMLEILRAGGFTTGGLNFDAKLRRQSIDRVDLFHGHIGGMDTMARALVVADAVRTELDAGRQARYAGWDGELGRSIMEGRTDLAALHQRASDRGEPARVSGGQERLENLVARHVAGPLMPLVAGVDSSTTATKVELRDVDDGRVVGRASAPHPPTRPPRSEQAPAAWWEAFRAAWAQIGAPAVAAISVAGQQHGMVALDGGREVIRPAKLWNDTESAADATWLIDRLDGGRQAWADACGCVPVASFTITKLSWLHRSEPEAWSRLAHVLLPHDWLTFRLTGRLVTDRGDASGTGYWSAAGNAYRPDLLTIVDGEQDWSSVVPEVLGPLETAGEWQGAAVGPGTGDNMAGALGVGLRAGDVVVSIGTSGTVYSLSDTPTADPAGTVAGFADATGRHLPLVCTLNATRVTDAVARLLGVDHDQLDALALAAAPGAGGLTLLPYFDGERTPDRPDATGLLAGIRSDVGREQLARAAVEGVVCGLLDGLDALGSFAPADGRLLLIGGGARSRAYRQVLADLSGRAVVVPDDEEQVAAGACVQAAAVATGAEPADVADGWSLGHGDTVEPGPASAAAADIRAAYARVRDRA